MFLDQCWTVPRILHSFLLTQLQEQLRAELETVGLKRGRGRRKGPGAGCGSHTAAPGPAGRGSGPWDTSADPRSQLVFPLQYSHTPARETGTETVYTCDSCSPVQRKTSFQFRGRVLGLTYIRSGHILSVYRVSGSVR